MTGVFRAAAAGGIGVFAAEMLQPHIEKVIKPDSDFARKAVKAGAAAVGTGVAWYVLGAVSGTGGK